MGKVKNIILAGAAAAVLAGGPLLASTTAMASEPPSAPGYGGGSVVPGGGDYTYPVQLEGATVKAGQTVEAPAPKAPDGSPVTVTSQEGLVVTNGEVTYPDTGYYHWTFQSADGSYNGVVLVRVV